MKRISLNESEISSAILSASNHKVTDVKKLFPVEQECYLILESQGRRPRSTRCGANESDFSDDQLGSIVATLKKHLDSTEIYCFFEHLALCSYKDESEDEDYDGIAYTLGLKELVDLVQIPKNNFTPSLWWSKDLSWFFANDVDMPYGVFGGSRALADAMLKTLPFHAKEISGNITTRDVAHIDHWWK